MTAYLVRVLHNVARGSFSGFDPTTADLRHAHNFQIDADNITLAAELVFMLGNVDPSSLPAHLSQYKFQIQDYRRRMNRSISVGDVLILVGAGVGTGDPRIFGTAGVMACEATGWKGLEYVPEHVDGTNYSPRSESYEAYLTSAGS